MDVVRLPQILSTGPSNEIYNCDWETGVFYDTKMTWQYPLIEPVNASSTPPEGCNIPRDNYNSYFECRCRAWFMPTI